MAAQLGRGGGLHFWAWHKDQPHQRSFAAEALTAVAATRDGAFCAAGGASGAPGSGGRASPFTAGGGSGGHAFQYGRVIELLAEDLLGDGDDDADVAVVKVLSAPHPMPPDEHMGAR